jgi:hypothetical protein
MKRASQITFILLFLGIIYTVPIVQTVYECRSNPDHRIQMLDLVNDLFVTPLEKARADASMIDSIVLSIDLLDRELAVSRDAAPDTAQPWDPHSAVEICDGSVINVTILKKSVVDYNRHMMGAGNTFAARDTLKPYYAALVKLGLYFDDLSLLLQATPPDAGAVQNSLETVRSCADEVKLHYGGADYAKLTLSAFRRIMVGANYLRPYETEMEKNSVFATAIRPWMLMGYYSAFGDLGNKGVKGAHDWIFYRPDVDYLVKPNVLDTRLRAVDANDVPMTDDIVDAIVDFKDQLASRGIDLLFVVMPTKPSIYPDVLNPKVPPEKSGDISISLRVIEQLRKAGVEAVDLFSALAKERTNDAANRDSLYLRTDTHFKGRGVLTVSRVIAGRVKRYPWYSAGTAEFAIDTVMTPRFGDIAEMIGLPPQVVAKRKPPFAPETTACYQVYQVERDRKGAISRKTLYKDDYRASNILILGDSFSRMYQTDQPKSSGWISHLALELSQPVASLVNDGGASTLVRQSLARKPRLLKNKKLVIWEVVERDFRFGEEGWKKIEMARE